MVNLGVSSDSLRRFMLKMMGICNIPEEEGKTLMGLVSNLTRANDLLQADRGGWEINRADSFRFRKGVKKKKKNLFGKKYA